MYDCFKPQTYTHIYNSTPLCACTYIWGNCTDWCKDGIPIGPEKQHTYYMIKYQKNNLFKDVVDGYCK